MPKKGKKKVSYSKVLYRLAACFIACALCVSGFGDIISKADGAGDAIYVRDLKEAQDVAAADEDSAGRAAADMEESGDVSSKVEGEAYTIDADSFHFVASDLTYQVKTAASPLDEVNSYFDWTIYEGRYIYNRLNEDERELYDKFRESSEKLIKTTVDCKTDKASVSGIVKEIAYHQLCYSSKLTLERAKDIAWLFIWQNPQYYFYNNSVFSGQNTSSGKVYIALGVYTDFADGKARAEATAEFAEALIEKEDYLEESLNGIQDIAKRETLIHDEVCSWLRYGGNTYDQSAYSSLCGENAGVTQCAGYAKLFELLLNRFNIPAIGVFSYDHGWNIVNVGGEWYNADATWDDSQATSTYLNRSDEYFRSLGSHIPRSYFDGMLPECPFDLNMSNTASEELVWDKAGGIDVNYRAQLQTFGWLPKVKNGQTGGVIKSGKRLQGFTAQVESDKDEDLGIRYRSYISDYGWEEWVEDGERSGQGLNQRIEAIMIELTGSDAEKYDVYYRVYIHKSGWMGWAKNGAKTGTIGQNSKIEAIQLNVLYKGEHPLSGTLGVPFVEAAGSEDVLDDAENTAASVYYRSYVQGVGYQRYVADGSYSGLPGASKRLEGINIKVNNAQLGMSGGVKYRTYVQTYGWLKWVTSSGNTVSYSGTKGEAKRIEAIQINLTGALASEYDIYYRVYSQDYGWLGWAKNGASAGTSGYAKRMEGIQITVVPKGTDAPGSTSHSFVKKS